MSAQARRSSTGTTTTSKSTTGGPTEKQKLEAMLGDWDSINMLAISENKDVEEVRLALMSRYLGFDSARSAKSSAQQPKGRETTSSNNISTGASISARPC